MFLLCTFFSVHWSRQSQLRLMCKKFYKIVVLSLFSRNCDWSSGIPPNIALLSSAKIHVHSFFRDKPWKQLLLIQRHVEHSYMVVLAHALFQKIRFFAFWGLLLRPKAFFERNGMFLDPLKRANFVDFQQNQSQLRLTKLGTPKNSPFLPDFRSLKNQSQFQKPWLNKWAVVIFHFSKLCF